MKKEMKIKLDISDWISIFSVVYVILIFIFSKLFGSFDGGIIENVVIVLGNVLWIIPLLLKEKYGPIQILLIFPFYFWMDQFFIPTFFY